jgi:S1-C subfamily serine protease
MGEGNNLERIFVSSHNIYGVQLKSVRPSLPADNAGLLNGDIVIELDGVPIRTRKELELRVDRSIPNTTIKVKIIRGTQRLEIPVKLMQSY